MSALQIIAIVICLATTVVAIALLARTVNHYLATFRLGQPEYRGDNKGERTPGTSPNPQPVDDKGAISVPVLQQVKRNNPNPNLAPATTL